MKNKAVSPLLSPTSSGTTTVLVSGTNPSVFGTAVTLTWSAFVPEFFLEYSTNQASTNWLAMPLSPLRTNGSLMVNLPVTSGPLIFRLHKF